MTSLHPFFSYKGSKWRLAPRYPPPVFDTIIEPFAGSAGYSLHYADRNIVLIERNPTVAGLWKWLISASPDDLISLPRLRCGESVDDYDLPKEAKWFMGYWFNQGGVYPSHKCSPFGEKSQPYERIASQLDSIRHWRVIEGDFSDAPDVMATWFIDPPYQVEGQIYRLYGPRFIDYANLGNWCRERKGQTIVCENAGATWLPFEPFATQQGFSNVTPRDEVVYLTGKAGL